MQKIKDVLLKLLFIVLSLISLIFGLTAISISSDSTVGAVISLVIASFFGFIAWKIYQQRYVTQAKPDPEDNKLDIGTDPDDLIEDDLPKIICHTEADKQILPSNVFLRRRNPPRLSNKLSDYITEIGVTIAVCPSCGVELPKFYQRKAKCRDCGEQIYSRKRPLDGKKVLLKEAELEELEKQNHIKNVGLKHYLLEFEHFEAVRENLSEKLNTNPRNIKDKDVRWSIFNSERMTYANERRFGLYRNTTLGMADQLSNEGRHKAALSMVLEVFYFDINGNYTVDFDQSSSGSYHWHWDESAAFVAPGIISYIEECINKSETPRDDMKDVWFKVAISCFQNYDFVVTPEQGWDKLKNHIVVE